MGLVLSRVMSGLTVVPTIITLLRTTLLTHDGFLSSDVPAPKTGSKSQERDDQARGVADLRQELRQTVGHGPRLEGDLWIFPSSGTQT